MGIMGEGDGLGISDNDTEFFFKFSTECILWSLALLNLATRELPKASARFPRWPLRDQHLAVLA